MGFYNYLIIIIIIFCVIYSSSQSRFVQAMDEQSYNSDSLNDFIRNYTYNNILRPKTGILYNLSLPSKFSGIEVSFVRFRTKSFRSNGANFSSFDIFPMTEPMPFVRRFDIIYENLGNLSSHYFNLPNYTLVSSVIGLSVYNATNPNGTKNTTLGLGAKGKPIFVNFPRISLPEGGKNVTTECVRFGANGVVEITNMTSPNVCSARGGGHFSVVVRGVFPSFPSSKEKKGGNKLWKWWVIGVGIVGLVGLALLGVFVYKFVKKGRIVKMEKEAERSEALGRTWIGDSRMPSADGIRTQPVLMNEDGP